MGQHLHLTGDLAKTQEIDVLDANHRDMPILKLERTFESPHHMQYRMRYVAGTKVDPRFPLHLRVVGPDFNLTVIDPPGLSEMVRHILQPCDCTALN
ncbi:MAG: hypothetical protein IPM75_14365 [Candidatus Competibacteraceae bacterium]|nr:hypothetical protein [Candidatus Competibacteraceae bacterium]